MRTGWYIKITRENIKFVEEWWYSNNYPSRAFNFGSYYGIDALGDNQANSQISRINGCEISFDEFKYTIYNGSGSLLYEIY